MTKDEAINVLKNTTLILGRVNGKMALAEALRMAITALEADNVVERIAYMSQLNGGANYFDAFMALSRSIKRNGEKSEALQTDGDCISRQAAIDEITEYGSGDTIYMSVVELKRRIEHLTPVQPERCEDCKNFSKTRLLIPQPERKKGKWIYGEHNVAMCDGYWCDKCGFFVPWDYQHKCIEFIMEYKYCPNCGAMMEEGAPT